MSSFRRVDYQKVYDFALKCFYYHQSRELELEKEAVEIMFLCEDVIGQQSDFPEEARELK